MCPQRYHLRDVLLHRSLVWTQLFWLFIAVTISQGEDDRECSDASLNGTCGSTAARLRWRGFPYRVKNPAFARRIYGGKYVEEAFAAAGFDGLEENEDWDVLWTHRPQDLSSVTLLARPQPRQRLVNHCSYFTAAGDKCNFARHTDNVVRSGKSSTGNRYLRSFQLRKEDQLSDWKRAVLEDPEQSWLLKPCDGGASKGIKVGRGQAILDEEAAFGANTIAQEYLHDIFQGFGARKFHLRLYFVVTRWSPTTVYLYDGGLVFRSVHSHDDLRAPSEDRDIFSSISKTVEAVPIAELWQHLDASYAAGEPGVLQAADIRNRIVEIIREILAPATVQQSFGKYGDRDEDRGYGCFDIFGADILLDRDLRPVVMEFNIGPNLWTTDHGEGHEQLLLSVKQPFMQQVTRWAALRSGSPPFTEQIADTMEANTLVNFTKIFG